ncbi:MAG: rod shape-determining protein RodA [Flavobacteriia bacterium]|nr:rod shape-determining protein RodA [Flavobacteriia bacterium]
MSRETAYRNNSLLGKIDWLILIIYIALVTIGIATIYSTAYNPEHPSLLSFSEKYGKQIAWVGVSFFLGFLIFLIDTTIYQKFAYFIYIFCLGLLVIVLFMPPVNGARAWLGIGSMGIQPAEFAKIGTALALAKFIPSLNIRTLDSKSVLLSNIIILIPMILIILQPDAGSFVVFTAFLFVLYREGLSYDPILLKLLRFLGITRLKSTWVGNHFIPLLFIVIVISMAALLTSNNIITFESLPGIELPGMYGVLLFFFSVFLLLLILVLIFTTKKDRSKFLLILIFSLGIVFSIVIGVDRMFQSLKKHQKERIELFLGLRECNGRGRFRRTKRQRIPAGQLIIS